jgi:hypothetical protein
MFVPSLTLAVVLAVMSSSPGDTTTQPPGAKVKPVVNDVADITGYYTCKGQEAAGKSYTGIAAITKKSDIYLVQWMVGSGSGFSGIGIRQGNNLAVSWSLQSERGTVRGVNLYRIETGPRLVGRWATLPGPGVMQTETLTFLKAMEEEE